MNLPNKLRNIALTQINAIKDRLDRIDVEAAEEAERKRYERDARAELDDLTDIRLPRRTPEEIAGGKLPAAPAASRPASTAAKREMAEKVSPPVAPSANSPLAVHYRVLGVEEGADYATVQAAYSKLAERCAPDRFPDGSTERKTADEIRKRVDHAFDMLRDALDPTAGRFDKLEF
jgi:hypothetical protein